MITPELSLSQWKGGCSSQINGRSPLKIFSYKGIEGTYCCCVMTWDALIEVTTLKGIIPICPSCKKNRHHKNFWNKLKSYIIE